MSQAGHEALSRVVIRLLLAEPFFGHLLGAVVRHVGTEVSTAAVGFADGRFHLYVNEHFFEKTLRSPSERVAVLKHEALHLLLQHVTRRVPARHDPLLHNLAADLVVNQLVGKWKLPKGAVTLASFPDLDLPPDQTVEVYYRRLATAREAWRASTKDGARKGDVRDPFAPYARGWHSDHRRWRGEDPAAEDLADAELGRVVAAVRARAGAQAWGDLPGSLRTSLEALLERRAGKVDWRRVLRLFAAAAGRTRRVDTMMVASRRYGTFPGTRTRARQRLLVALDTSGSVADAQLGAFFGEVRGLARAGAEVDIVECDAAVQRVYPWRGEVPGSVHGRGGTAFEPVFAWMRERRERVYDACFYLTDGQGPPPSTRPPCPCLWVLTPDGTPGPHLRFGRSITLPA